MRRAGIFSADAIAFVAAQDRRSHGRHLLQRDGVRCPSVVRQRLRDRVLRLRDGFGVQYGQPVRVGRKHRQLQGLNPPMRDSVHGGA